MVWLKKYSKAINDFYRLSLDDKFLIMESWFELLRVIILLRTPFRVRFFKQHGSGQSSGGRDIEILNIKRLLQNAASYHIKHITCLEYAVALQNILNRRGFNVKVNIGVKGAGSNFEAHAWIDSGAIKDDWESHEFTILSRINDNRS